MKDWNVVVTVFQDGYKRVLRALEKLGSVERTPYHNVVVMKVDDPTALLEAIEKIIEENPALYDAISRVAPAIQNVDFLSEIEFVDKVKSIICEWSPNLAGRSFHVRWHRRGAKHDLHTHDVERIFNDAIVGATTTAGTPSKISFTDPDMVITVDTVDHRAGLAMWTREDRARFHLLRPD